MKATARLLPLALLLALCRPAAAQEPDIPALPAPSQPAPSQQAPREPWLFLGPRAGLTWVMAEAGRFDEEMDDAYAGGRSYFPLYSELGFGLAQHFRLRPGAYRLILQETLLLAGLDQNFVLPSLGLRIGVHLPVGLEAGLGPELPFSPGRGLQPALVYALGWRFALKSASLPVLLLLSPRPEDRLPRLTLLSGVDFELLPAPRRKTPFNY